MAKAMGMLQVARYVVKVRVMGADIGTCLTIRGDNSVTLQPHADASVCPSELHSVHGTAGSSV